MQRQEIERLKARHRCKRTVTKMKQLPVSGCWEHTEDVDCEVERCSGSCGLTGIHFKKKSLIRRIFEAL